MSARVLFTVAVLAVFVAAIVYTALCARAAVAAEAAAMDDQVTVRCVRPLVAAYAEPEPDVLDDLRPAA